jgi:hypothetical protein
LSWGHASIDLQVFFDEILAAPTTIALLHGIYDKAVPATLGAMQTYAEEVNPLADAPSRRVLRFAQMELRDMLAYGAFAIDGHIERLNRYLPRLLSLTPREIKAIIERYIVDVSLSSAIVEAA